MSAEIVNLHEDDVRSGMHERHILRKDGNPLFGVPVPGFSAHEILEARHRDTEELHVFHNDMREVIQQAIDLAANVESEVVLELRGKLDQLYTRCSGFGSECGEHKQNIRKLIDLVMKAVWQAAGDDPQARMELEQEEMARQEHFRLLEYPLIADLMRPDTPIENKELIPTLLSADEEELEAVMWIFEPEHLAQIANDAEQLLTERKEQGYDLAEAWEKLQVMREFLSV